MSSTTLKAHLARLEEASLIRPTPHSPDASYKFNHALVQDVVYESMLKIDRQRLHQAVGETLEDLFAEQLDSPEIAPRLAEHFLQGGDARRALHYFRQAAQAEAKSYANREAAEHYQQAINLAKRIGPSIATDELTDIYLAGGRALELSGDFQNALALYQDMQALAENQNAASVKLAALIAQATILSTNSPVHNPELGRELSTQALSLARSLNDPESEAKVLWNLQLLFLGLSQAKEAINYGEKALALARQHNLVEQEAYALNDLQYAYQLLGHFDKSETVTQEANVLWRQLNNKPMLADNLSRMSLNYYLKGEYDAALKTSAEAQAITKAGNNLWGEAFSMITTSFIYYDRGNIDKTLQQIEAVVEINKKINLINPITLSFFVSKALIYAQLGHIQAGFEIIDQALRWGEQTGKPSKSWALSPHMVKTRLHLLAGEIEPAMVLLKQYKNLIQLDEPLTFATFWGFLAQAELALAQNKLEEMLDIAELMIGFQEKWNLYPYQSEIVYLQALAFHRLRLPQQVAKSLVQALALAQRINERRMLWQILLAQAQQKPDSNEATRLQAEAQQHIDFIAQHIPQADLRAHFLAQPAQVSAMWAAV
jgi:tetratricopeptide (TPR) repeat protein